MREDHGWAGVLEGKIQPADGSTPVDGRIRLDIGAGHIREQGWIAVDHAEGYSFALSKPLDPDVEADLSKLPFPDNYADEARAIHVIEHFYAWEALGVVKEWVRVLKPGATIAIECPCLEKVIKLMDVPHVEPRYTYWALYGDPRHKRPDMCHKWAYTHVALTRLMLQAGLEDVKADRPQFHFPVRDMRLVGKKPESVLMVPPNGAMFAGGVGGRG